jgi:hypothetical protein
MNISTNFTEGTKLFTVFSNKRFTKGHIQDFYKGEPTCFKKGRAYTVA